MTRYVAFLRGVSPQNARSADLKCAFEKAGFDNVKTVLSSGNVVFDTNARTEAAIERKIAAVLQAALGRGFYPIVRSAAALERLLAGEPYSDYKVPTGAKRVVSFVRAPCRPKVKLPLAADDACVFGMRGREVFTAYTPGPKGPVFMRLIEQAFGTEITTRTWETVRKCAAA